MLIVGIHNTGILSSAALVAGGELLFGCAEERLDRRKYSKYFPHRAIDACLRHAGATLRDVDAFAIGWNPAINIGGRYRAGLSEWPAHAGARFYSNPNHLLPAVGGGDFQETQQIFRRADGTDTRIRYVTHHLAHAANAFLLSHFERAAILSCDGYGERASTVWATGGAAGIDILRQADFPHSVGALYAALTEFLGFRPDLDEWKVMGAAAYGDPARFYDRLRGIVRWDERAELEIDLSYFDFFNFEAPARCRPKLAALLGEPRRDGEPIEQRHHDLAAAVQKVTEDYLAAALRWLHEETRVPAVCLTGGVLMNSVFNGKASLLSPFEQVFVPFAPDDSGNSIGAALWVAWQEGDLRGRRVCNSPYLGRAYPDDEVRETLDRYGLRYTHQPDIASAVADLLAAGRIVGWFQGRMEFGQRALGSRSIVADPRQAGMKDRINRAVKYREAFRPFAPSVLEEAETTYFETDRFVPVPYMEKVLPVREEMRARIPAVVHADGSGRLQTVSRAAHPLYHALIEAFCHRTGVPVVLNTSFNLNGEPIVESPTDAVRTFFSSGLEALALGSYLLVKP